MFPYCEFSFVWEDKVCLYICIWRSHLSMNISFHFATLVWVCGMKNQQKHMAQTWSCLPNCCFQELDFLVEAKNGEKCLDNFRKLSPHLIRYVYAPRVFWNLSTSKLLTMEFMDAAEITDVKKMQELGIQPREVAKLVSHWPLIYLMWFRLLLSRNV